MPHARFRRFGKQRVGSSRENIESPRGHFSATMQFTMIELVSSITAYRLQERHREILQSHWVNEYELVWIMRDIGPMDAYFLTDPRTQSTR